MSSSELQTTDSAASRTKKSTVSAEANRSPGLPLAFVEELRLLDSEHQLTAATFADALLRCAPSKCVERLSTVLCLYDFQPVQKPAQKHGLEDIARAGLNLNLYQQASGAFDFSSDDVLGRKFARTASSTGKDKLTLAWEKLGKGVGCECCWRVDEADCKYLSFGCRSARKAAASTDGADHEPGGQAITRGFWFCVANQSPR